MSLSFKKLCFVLIVFAHSAAYANLLSYWDLEFGLEFPSHFGIHTKISQHEHIYARLGAGIVHSVMLRTPFASQLMNMTSSLKDDEMSLIIDTVSDSIYIGASLGYRQSVRSGFYGEIGYSNIFRVEPKEVMVKSIQEALGRDFGENAVNYNVRASVHNATLHTGYMFPLSKHLSLSAELGVMKPFYTQVSLDYKDVISASAHEKPDSKKIQDLIGSLWMVTGALWVSVTF